MDTGYISFYFTNGSAKGFKCNTNIDFLKEHFVVSNDRIKGRLIFRRPILSDNKVIKSYKKKSTHITSRFYLNTQDIEPGTYTDIEFIDETLVLYYR